jgi:hypothetical protein
VFYDGICADWHVERSLREFAAIEISERVGSSSIFVVVCASAPVEQRKVRENIKESQRKVLFDSAVICGLHFSEKLWRR